MTTLRRVERYLLGERIGSGGMSSVYCAVQLGPLGIARPVAVKELHPHLARDADFVSMLLDEARIQGAVEHPNVVSVIDVIARGGELFIVLALVHGVSLSDIVRRLREGGACVPPAIAVAIACDVLEGLYAAHELCGADGARLGVVHRDVSPHNVLVGADGVSRILDFGIAKAETRAQVTRGGQLKGKPSYMSPEHLDGDALDRRSDVFAAALVLVEMLTARRSCPQTEPGEARRWMSRELATPARWLEGAGVPPSLIAPIATCLELDARARPESARACAVALCAAQPRATAAEVAMWMDQTVVDLLDERRAISTRLRAAASAHVETMPTQPATQRAEVPESQPRSPKRPARLVASAIGAALVVGGFVCGRSTTLPLASSSGVSEKLAAAASGTVASPRLSSEVASAASASGGFLVASVPDVAASPLARAGATSREASAERPLVAAKPRPTVLARRPEAAPAVAASASALAPVTSARSCDPPYTVEATGVRVFKPECL